MKMNKYLDHFIDQLFIQLYCLVSGIQLHLKIE